MLTTSSARAPAPPRPIFPISHLSAAIAHRRAELAALEETYVAACEEAAIRGAAPGVIREDRDTWDRATWDRYLAEAARLEPAYGPRLRQLHGEIERLGRVGDLRRAA